MQKQNSYFIVISVIYIIAFFHIVMYLWEIEGGEIF